MRLSQFFVPTLVALLAGACGGQGGDVASSADIATYQALSVDVQSEATAYRSTMNGPGVTTEADCRRVHDAYDAQVRPWVSQMGQMAPGMDGFMEHHDGFEEADMTCGAALMADELDHHDAAACSGPDLAADRAEAQRHADAMLGYADHAQERCDEMLMGGGMWQWQPMLQQCQSWDGCCADAMHDCCGGMMHGGMMGDDACCP